MLPDFFHTFFFHQDYDSFLIIFFKAFEQFQEWFNIYCDDFEFFMFL